MFNLKNLMLRAWDLRRSDGLSMADALRMAWAEVKAATYAVHMDEKRESVASCLAKLVITDIHQQHKADILRAALRADLVDGVAMLWGKAAGLVAWACRNA